MLQIPSVLLSVAPVLSGSFAVVLYNTWYSDASIDLNSSAGPAQVRHEASALPFHCLPSFSE